MAAAAGGTTVAAAVAAMAKIWLELRRDTVVAQAPGQVLAMVLAAPPRTQELAQLQVQLLAKLRACS